MNETVSSSKRFLNSSERSTRSTAAKTAWWFTQMIPIVMKLTAKPAYEGHRSSSPWASEWPSSAFGTLISSTSSVMAIANTPSLNASSRALLMAARSPRAADYLGSSGASGALQDDDRDLAPALAAVAVKGRADRRHQRPQRLSLVRPGVARPGREVFVP